MGFNRQQAARGHLLPAAPARGRLRPPPPAAAPRSDLLPAALARGRCQAPPTAAARRPTGHGPVAEGSQRPCAASTGVDRSISLPLPSLRATAAGRRRSALFRLRSAGEFRALGAGLRGGALWDGRGGAGWSHENVAPPLLWKPLGAPAPAPAPAPHPELVQISPFGRAPSGAARGALPNGTYITTRGG